MSYELRFIFKTHNNIIDKHLDRKSKDSNFLLIFNDKIYYSTYVHIFFIFIFINKYAVKYKFFFPKLIDWQGRTKKKQIYKKEVNIGRHDIKWNCHKL